MLAAVGGQWSSILFLRNCLLGPAGNTLYCCLCEVVFHSHASLSLCVALWKTEKGLKQQETTKYLVLPAEEKRFPSVERNASKKPGVALS